MRRHLSVLVVLRYFPTRSETFVVREIAELRARGVRVEILAIGHRADGYGLDPLPEVVVHRPGRRIGGFLRRHRGAYDVVHAHFDGEASTLARRVARAWDVPWSVTIHAVDLFRPQPGWVRRLREADAVFTVCAHHRDWIHRETGVEAEIARCGVPVGPIAEQVGQQAGRVVAVARDVPKKHLARLRRATLGHPTTIVTAGSAADVQDALAGAALFAMPCRVAGDGDRDGVPVAMMEAMARGVPVVTRPVAGIGELVDPTVGWIAADFERILGEALAAPEERVSRGRRARARIAADWSVDAGPRVLVARWDRVRS